MLRQLLGKQSTQEKENKTVISSSQNYIQRLMSIPKSVVTWGISSFEKQNILGLMKLILAMDFLSYLPKANADQIYVLFDKINYALTFDKSGPLDTLTNHLTDACQNLTILGSSQCNYTDFFSTGCTSLNGDAHLTMSIQTDNNNTQALLNCTLDIVNKLNAYCSEDQFIKGALIFLASFLAFACLLLCVASVIRQNKKITPEETPTSEMIELKHSTSAPASIEIHEVKKDRTIEDVPPRDIEAASAPPPNYKEEFTRNETDTFNPKISVAKSSSFLNEFTEKPSTPKNESSNNIDLLKAPGSEVRAL